MGCSLRDCREGSLLSARLLELTHSPACSSEWGRASPAAQEQVEGWSRGELGLKHPSPPGA